MTQPVKGGAFWLFDVMIIQKVMNSLIAVNEKRFIY